MNEKTVIFVAVACLLPVGYLGFSVNKKLSELAENAERSRLLIDGRKNELDVKISSLKEELSSDSVRIQKDMLEMKSYQLKQEGRIIQIKGDLRELNDTVNSLNEELKTSTYYGAYVTPIEPLPNGSERETRRLLNESDLRDFWQPHCIIRGGEVYCFRKAE